MPTTRIFSAFNAINAFSANSAFNANSAFSANNANSANSANNALQCRAVVVVVGKRETRNVEREWDGRPFFLLYKKERGSMLVEFGFVEHRHRRLFFDMGLEGLHE